MVINKRNCEIINTKELYIHDDVFELLTFDRDNKKLILDLHKYYRIVENQYYRVNEKYKIIFNDVMGFTITSCDPWGSGECVFDFINVASKDYILIPDLEKRWLKTNNEIPNIRDNCIESFIEFSSGDQLRIVSKEIVIEDWDWCGNLDWYGKVRIGKITKAGDDFYKLSNASNGKFGKWMDFSDEYIIPEAKSKIKDGIVKQNVDKSTELITNIVFTEE